MPKPWENAVLAGSNGIFLTQVAAVVHVVTTPYAWWVLPLTLLGLTAVTNSRYAVEDAIYVRVRTRMRQPKPEAPAAC